MQTETITTETGSFLKDLHHNVVWIWVVTALIIWVAGSITAEAMKPHFGEASMIQRYQNSWHGYYSETSETKSWDTYGDHTPPTRGTLVTWLIAIISFGWGYCRAENIDNSLFPKASMGRKKIGYWLIIAPPFLLSFLKLLFIIFFWMGL